MSWAPFSRLVNGLASFDGRWAAAIRFARMKNLVYLKDDDTKNKAVEK